MCPFEGPQIQVATVVLTALLLLLHCARDALTHSDQTSLIAEAPDLGLEGAEKQDQVSQEDQEEEEDLPDEQLAAKTERQLARKGITFEAKQSTKVGLSYLSVAVK